MTPCNSIPDVAPSSTTYSCCSACTMPANPRTTNKTIRGRFIQVPRTISMMLQMTVPRHASPIVARNKLMASGAPGIVPSTAAESRRDLVSLQPVRMSQPWQLGISTIVTVLVVTRAIMVAQVTAKTTAGTGFNAISRLQETNHSLAEHRHPCEGGHERQPPGPEAEHHVGQGVVRFL